MASRASSVRALSASATTASAASASKAAVGSSSRYNAVVKNAAVSGLQNGMDYVKLGDSDLVVSKVCMGTMNFGYVPTRLRSGPTP
jgi:hypothetical protein